MDVRFVRLLRIFSIAIAVLALSGCGMKSTTEFETGGLASSQRATLSVSSPTQAYQATFYQFATANCLPCHDGSATSAAAFPGAPAFAASDIGTAYIASQAYVNLTTPAQSLVVTFAMNGHCLLSNCTGAAQSNAALVQVQEYAAAVAAIPTAPSPTPTSTYSLAQRMATFQTSYYAFATASGTCVTCHVTGGVTAVFPFADPNLTTAYNAALSLANFSMGNSSFLVTYAGNNHCGVAACQTATQQGLAQTAFDTWEAVEVPSPSPSPSPTM